MLINPDATETLRKVYTDLYQANKAENVENLLLNLKNMVSLCNNLILEIDATNTDLRITPPSPTETPPES